MQQLIVAKNSFAGEERVQSCCFCCLQSFHTKEKPYESKIQQIIISHNQTKCIMLISKKCRAQMGKERLNIKKDQVKYAGEITVIE